MVPREHRALLVTNHKRRTHLFQIHIPSKNIDAPSPKASRVCISGARVYLKHRTTATFHSENVRSLVLGSAIVAHAALFTGRVAGLTFQIKPGDGEAAPSS
jgi:hypothetical protein